VTNYKINLNWLKIDKLIGFGLHEGCWAFSTVSWRNQSNCYCRWLTIKLINNLIDMLSNWLKMWLFWFSHYLLNMQGKGIKTTKPIIETAKPILKA